MCCEEHCPTLPALGYVYRIIDRFVITHLVQILLLRKIVIFI